MPQYADPNVLLGAKPADIQTPYQLLGGALTIGDLATGLQSKQLALQKQQDLINLYSDPQYLQMMSSVMGGGQGGQGGPDFSMLSGHPAAPEALGQMFGIAKESAGIQQSLGSAAESTAKARIANLGPLAASANFFANNPTPEGATQFAGMVNSAVRNGAIKQSDLGPLPTDMQSAVTFAQRIATLATPQNEQFQMSVTAAKLPSELAQLEAQIAKERAETGAIVPATQQKWITALSDAVDKYKPDVKIGANGQQIITYPNGAAPAWLLNRMQNLMQGNPGSPPAGAPLPTSGQVSGFPAGVQTNFDANATPQDIASAKADAWARAAGQQPPPAPGVAAPTPQPQPSMTPPTSPGEAFSRMGPKVDYNEYEKGTIKSASDEVGQLVASSQPAAQMKQMVIDQRARDISGIYGGKVEGTQFFNDTMGVLNPILSDEARAKLANTQAWNAESGQIVVQAIKQFVGSGGRVAAREIDYFKTIKPDQLNTAEGRQEMYSVLYRLADRIQQQARQADAYMKQPGQTSLAGFAPQFTENKMPPLTVSSLPPAANFPSTKAVVLPDGRTVVSRGGQWVDIKTAEPASRESEVPQ